MFKIPRGVYSYHPNTGTHSVTYPLIGKTFDLSADSIPALLNLIDIFWCPHSNFETVTAYNKAWKSSQEDTCEIEIERKAG